MRSVSIGRGAFFLLALAALAVGADAAEITSLRAEQMWPWSTDIRIRYSLSDVFAPVDLKVSVSNDGKPLDLPEELVRGQLRDITGDGERTLTFDPIAAFGTEVTALADLKVRLELSSAGSGDPDEALYKVFDLNDGSCTDVTRRDLLAGRWGSFETDYAAVAPGFSSGLRDVLVWTGVTNDIAYKTDKLVMRKVHAQNVVWQCGDPEDVQYQQLGPRPRHWVKLNYDYYIQVFEMTKAQYAKIEGALPSGCAAGEGADAGCYPVNNVLHYEVNGYTGSDYASYNTVRSDEKLWFPQNTYVRDVGKLTLCARLWSRTGYEFNLPTGAEWEFACRGGQDGPLYSGEAQTKANANRIAWNTYNSGAVQHPVGQLAPNAYGLYDMLGNVMEHTTFSGQMNQGAMSGTGASADDPLLNPLGDPEPSRYSASWYVMGGSCYNDSTYGSWKDMRPTMRCGWYPYYQTSVHVGLRLVCPATREWGADWPRSYQSAAVADVLPTTKWSAHPTKTVVATTDQAFPRTVLVGAREAQPMAVTIAGTAADGVTSGTVGLTLQLNYTGANSVWGHHADLDFSGPGRQEKKVTIYCNGRLDNVYAYYSASSGITLEPLKIELYDPVADACLDGVPVMRPDEALGAGFLMRDVGADGGYVRLDGWTVTRGIRFSEGCERDGDVRRITGRLEDTTGADRALTLLYAVPLPEGEIVWWNDPRQSRTADPASLCELCNVTGESSGRGAHSKWPIAAVTVGGRGIGIGIDPLRPAYYRFALNPKLRLLYIAYDLGLAAPERDFADVSLCVFDFPAEEGFRGALEKYRSIYPDAFAARVTKHGGWVPFEALSKLPGGQVEDFGFRFNEYMYDTAFDDAHGILSLRYKEPCTWWMKLKGASGGLPSYDECLARAEELSRGISRPEDWETEEDRRNALDGAQTWLTSVFRDRKGQPAGMILDKPWCHGIAWSMNAAPGIPCPPGGMTEYSYKQSEADFEANYGATEFPEGRDGEYVDSSELACTVAEDHDRAHFAAMRSPLTFSADGHRPVVFKGLSVWDYCEDLSRRLRARNRVLFANATPNHWSYLTPLMDAVGIEIGWGDGGEWNPAGAEQLLYWRAVAGDKPYCLLMTNGPQFTREMTEKYMKLCLAYALLPGFQSNYFFDGAGRHERDRDLWRKYMPLICRLSEAGWRPVNRLASAAGAGLVCEQFGERYLTLYNHGSEPVTAEVTFMVSVASVTDLVSGAALPVVGGKSSLEFGPGEVAVLEVGSAQ